MTSARGLDPAALRAIVAAVDPALRVTASRPLAGGVSARVTAIETPRCPAVSGNGSCCGSTARPTSAADPHAAVHEYELLSLLHAAGQPVPRPHYADESGAILPGPWLLIEFVDGARSPSPASRRRSPQPARRDAGRGAQAAFGLADAPYLTDIRDFSARKLGTWPDVPDVATERGGHQGGP